MSKPKKSQIVFYSCLAFLAGVTTRVFVDLPLLAVFIPGAVAFSLLVIAWPWRWGKAAGFVVLFFALGMFRLAVDLPQAAPANLTNRHDQTLTFTGLVVKEPDRRFDHAKLTVKALADERGEELSGRALVKTSLYPAYNYGDVLRLTCRLTPPGIIEPKEIDGRPFDYGRYLARDHIYTLCVRPEAQLLATDRGQPV